MRNRYANAGVAMLLLLALVISMSAITNIVSINAGSRVRVMTSEEAGIDWVTDAQKLQSGEPIVRYPARAGVSTAALRDLPARVTPKVRKDENWHEPRRIGPGTPGNGQDTTIQDSVGPFVMPTTIANFDGMYNLNGYIPPDTNGDVGRDQYVQTVNSTFQVFNKTTGASLYGPANINTLWTNFGGRCETDNDGDPIAQYDSISGRWLISQFSTATPSHQCIAISASEDATGVYYLYDYVSGPTAGAFEDYPHFGVWPDAYYMASNEFGGPNGGGNFAFERQRMIVGDPTARMVFFGSNDSGLLPSDLDGGALPPAGSPNYFVTYPNFSSLALYKFHVDWTTPANSTFTGPTTIPVTAFSSSIGTVPQLGTTVRVDALNDRLMYRLAYRNFGTHESLALNFTVSTGGVTAPRWYELRNPGGTPTVFQEGTYAPADGIFRWMGSIAMDKQGNMAMGFSASNSSMFPDIRYTGRLVTDPVGQMSQGEAIMHPGGGSETNAAAARWGDYSSLTVDPSDDCTFWYTTEYFAQTGPRNWRTRIGSFKFPGCSGSSTPVPTATAAPPTATAAAPSPTACANYVSYTGVITNSDPTQTGRVLRSHPPSSCAAPNAGSVNADGFVRHYDTYTYTNSTGFAQCVTIRVTNACGDNTTGSAAYLNTFNPANLAQNYLGDYGETGGPQYSYSVSLPAGQSVVVVVHELSPNLGCASYTVEINPCTVGGPTATATPTGGATNTPVPPTATGTTAPPTSTNTGQPATATGTPTTFPGTLTPTGTTAVTETPGTPVATPTACTLEFADVLPGNTFYDNIRCLACRGIINGYPCGGDGEPCNSNNDPYFRPSNNISRGQLAKVVSISAGFTEPVTGQSFEDVAPGTTFYDYIERLASRDVMGGYPCGIDPNEPCVSPGNLPYFRPGASATRGQLTKIVSNAAGFTDPDPSTFTFTDVPPGSTFHLYVERLLINRPGVMNGYPCSAPAEPCDDQNRPYFRPSATLTRGQTSKIIANTFFPGCSTPSK